MGLRFYGMPQRSEQWFEIRRGLLTASRADRVLTSSLEVSRSAPDLIRELIAERCRVFTDVEATFWMERGVLLESEAVQEISIVLGVDIERVGFVASQDLPVGCSPDGIFRNGHGLGVIEVKCLKPVNHLKVLDSDRLPAAYVPQAAFTNWLLRPVEHLVFFYCPKLPLKEFRFALSDDQFGKVDLIVRQFCESLENEWARFAERYGYQAKWRDQG